MLPSLLPTAYPFQLQHHESGPIFPTMLFAQSLPSFRQLHKAFLLGTHFQTLRSDQFVFSCFVLRYLMDLATVCAVSHYGMKTKNKTSIGPSEIQSFHAPRRPLRGRAERSATKAQRYTDQSTIGI